jgi:hypothetical protein
VGGGRFIQSKSAEGGGGGAVRRTSQGGRDRLLRNGSFHNEVWGGPRVRVRKRVTETETEKQRIERVYKERTPVMFSAAQTGTGDVATRCASNITGSRGATGEKGGRGGGGRIVILWSHPVVDYFFDIITECKLTEYSTGPVCRYGRTVLLRAQQHADPERDATLIKRGLAVPPGPC